MYPFVKNIEELKKHTKFPFRNFATNKEEFLYSWLHWLYMCKPYIKHHKNLWRRDGVPISQYIEFSEGDALVKERLRCKKGGLAVALQNATNENNTPYTEPFLSPFFVIVYGDNDDELFESSGIRHEIQICTDLGDEKCYEFLHNFLKIIFIDDLPFEQLKDAINIHNHQYETQYCRYK